VTKQFLHHADISTVRNHMSGATVSKGVCVEARLINPFHPGAAEQYFVDPVTRERVASLIQK